MLFVIHCETFLNIALVSCSSTGCRLGGVKMGSGSTGKLGRAWVGAWVHGGWFF